MIAQRCRTSAGHATTVQHDSHSTTPAWRCRDAPVTAQSAGSMRSARIRGRMAALRTGMRPRHTGGNSRPRCTISNEPPTRLKHSSRYSCHRWYSTSTVPDAMRTSTSSASILPARPSHPETASRESPRGTSRRSSLLLTIITSTRSLRGTSPSTLPERSCVCCVHTELPTGAKMCSQRAERIEGK